MSFASRYPLAAALLALCAFAATVAHAQAPAPLAPAGFPYSGRLELSGAAVEGTRDLKFALHDSPEDGSMLWQGELSRVRVSEGRFFVILGQDEANPIHPAVLLRPEVYLQLSVHDQDAGSWEDMVGRQRLWAVPFALSAGNGVPFGAILPYFGAVPPPGWLIADGGLISSNEGECGGAELCSAGYASLVTHLRETVGAAGLAEDQARLPDLRGVFLRGANLGRATGLGNPDGDQALGTFQVDEAGPHTHPISDPGHTHTEEHVSRQRRVDDNGSDFLGGGNSTTNTGWSTTGISVQTNSSVETRPRNVTVLHIIKY